MTWKVREDEEMPKLVQCDVHGSGPGYVVCLHIPWRQAVYIDRATETHLGQAVCADCKNKQLKVDDVRLICAGCFADSQTGFTFAAD